MSTHPITSKIYNTPQIAEPRERASLQVGHNPAVGLLDLWVHPEKYRSIETKDRHSLDILA
jgi:hypothetical protein